MSLRGPIIIAGLAICTAEIFAWSVEKPYNPGEQALISKIDKVISSNPPRGEDIISAFSLPENCRSFSCSFGKGKVGDLRFSSGSLRQSEGGLFFGLEGFANTCVRTELIQAHYGTGGLENDCNHLECWYIRAQHDWGTLAFNLREAPFGRDDKKSKCISSVIVSTQDFMRP
jgi:hypothetical protein